MSCRIATEAAARAASRRAASVHLELKRGLNLLASVPATAALLGVAVTVDAILGSFKGCPCPQGRDYLAYIAWSLGQALVPLVWGLGIAVVALWSHRFLDRQADVFDREMAVACIDLTSWLESYDPPDARRAGPR